MIDGDKWMDREVSLHRFEQRERRDGPRYCEAIRGAREMRRKEADFLHPFHGCAMSSELDEGLPEGWVSR